METIKVNNKISIEGPVPPLENPKRPPESNEKTYMGFFRVLKLGDSKWTSNYRLLIVQEDKIIYCDLPKSKGMTENFMKTFDKIYNSKKPNPNSKNAHFEEEYDILRKEYNDNTSSFKEKDRIPFDSLSYMHEGIEKENTKKWQHCILIKEKSSESGDRIIPASYQKILDENQTNKKKDTKKKNTLWVIGFLEDFYLERFKAIIESILKKKSNTNLREISHPKFQEPTVKITKNKDEEVQKKEISKPKDDNTPYVEPDTIYLMSYNEVAYQYLLKSYYLACSLKVDAENLKKLQEGKNIIFNYLILSFLTNK